MRVKIFILQSHGLVERGRIQSGRKNGGRGKEKNDNKRGKIITARVIFVIQKDLFFVTV